jgi:hypothetical protein
MPRVALAFALLGIALGLMLNAAPASAQLDHTYVSRTGSGSTCSFASPCNSVNAAIQATNAGGDVSILNGDYTENVIIDRSISITGESTDAIIIRPTTTNGTSTTVTVNAPSNASVNLGNLSIFGDLNGITFNTGGRLNLGGVSTGGSNVGLNFIPNAAASSGSTELTMTNASIGGGQGNILIKPSNSVAVTAFLTGVKLRGGTFGLRADDTGGSGTIRVDFQNGSSNAHRSGLVALGSGAGAVGFVIDHCTIMDNIFGAVAAGAQANMVVTDSTLVYNTVGMDQEASAVLADYANNVIHLNGTDISGTVTTLAKQ